MVLGEAVVGSTREGVRPGSPSDGQEVSDPSVAHVLDTETYAGRESVVERLAAGQHSAGADVRVVAVVESSSGRVPFLEAIERTDVPVDVLRLPARAYLEERRRLIELFRERGTDVVHTHGYRPDVVGGNAAKRAGAARVSTVHGFVGGGWKNRLYERLQCWSLRGFDRVVAVSRGVAEELSEDGVPSSAIRVVRNAWDGREDFLSREQARERLGVGQEQFLVGWVGRLSREKGPDVLLDAVRRLERQELSVSVIGDGPERKRLAREVEERGGVELTLHGQIPSAYRLFPAFDVFVLSSRTEGTPMVLLEAMAAGVPVVATRVGGVGDVVSGEEALLVPPEDPEALGRTIARVRRKPDEAAGRVSAARQRLDREFGVDQWVSRYAQVYREAVRARSDAGERR